MVGARRRAPVGKGRVAMARGAGGARTVLFVESKSDEKRFLFLAARRLGLRVALLKREPVTWERELVDDVLPRAGEDAAAVLAQARAYAAACAACHPVAAVIAFLERYVELGAAVGRSLGVPALSAEAARAARDKLLMRQRLAAAGLPQPRFFLVGSGADARRAAADVGGPVVVKPRAGWASLSVVRADDPLAAGAAYLEVAAVCQAKFGTSQVLVEEYVAGAELSVELVRAAGRTHLLSITDKPLPMTGPAFMELEHVTPSQHPVPLQDEVRRLAVLTLDALGIDVGAAHVEMRLGPDGPRLVEAAARPGGNRIPDLVRLSRGADMGEMVLRAHLGEPAAEVPSAVAAAGIRFLLFPRSGVLRRAAGLDEVRAWPGVVEAECYFAPGAEVTAPSDRLPRSQYYLYAGHVLAVGAAAGAVHHMLDEAARAVRLEVE